MERTMTYDLGCCLPGHGRRSVAVAVSALILTTLVSGASAQNLGTFAVLGGSAVTNTGPSVINGNLGVSPGSAITGFPPGIVPAPYTIYQNNAVAAQAQSELTTAYNVLAGRPFTADLTGQDLGGKTLIAGVYNFNTGAGLTGTVTLDAQNDPNATFVFNIGSALTTAGASRVELVNGAKSANIYYRVGSSATLGAATVFKGKILALTSITLINGATIDCGAALARNGAVTLDTNTIGICPAEAVVVAPGDVVVDDNDTALLAVLNDFVANGGVLPPGFDVLRFLTPAELVIALSQISGESATGFAPTGIDSMNSFLDVVRNAGRQGGTGPTYTNTAPATVSVMGYAAEPAAPSAFSTLDLGPAPQQASHQMWGALYGGYSLTSGSAAAGTSDRRAMNYGVATGFITDINADTRVGVALGGGGTDYSLANGLGGGHSNTFQLALHGRTEIGAAHLSAAVGYGLHDVTTSRYVTFAGVDHFSGRYLAQSLAGEVEAGYALGAVTPYAALRGQVLYTPGYSEATQSGASTFAMTYGAHTALAARVEVGARLDWSQQLDGGGTFAVQAGAAYVHDIVTATQINTSLQALPGSAFSVNGATPAADKLQLSLNAEVGLADGLTFGASVQSALALNAQAYSGSLRISRHW
jgi:uncharacterized protein with beta-barrel porin domain